MHDPDHPSATEPAYRTRSFVLVHGGFHGGWCWDQVALRLRALGHVVYAPTQTGCAGDKRDIGVPPGFSA